jgi:hypothetical protein
VLRRLGRRLLGWRWLRLGGLLLCGLRLGRWRRGSGRRRGGLVLLPRVAGWCAVGWWCGRLGRGGLRGWLAALVRGGCRGLRLVPGRCLVLARLVSGGLLVTAVGLTTRVGVAVWRRGLGWWRGRLGVRGLARGSLGTRVGGRSLTAGLVDDREFSAHRYRLVLGNDDPAQDPGHGRGDLGVDFVGGDLEQRLVRLHALTLLLEPARDSALGNALTELGHGYGDRHGFP